MIDQVADLEFFPDVRMIHVNWTLQNPSGNVTRFVVSYTRQEGQRADFDCSVNSPSLSTLESDDCMNQDALMPNSTYMISVQPFDADGGTGYLASGLSDTLPG